jgi:hypothetical protein
MKIYTRMSSEKIGATKGLQMKLTGIRALLQIQIGARTRVFIC